MREFGPLYRLQQESQAPTLIHFRGDSSGSLCGERDESDDGNGTKWTLEDTVVKSNALTTIVETNCGTRLWPLPVSDMTR